MMNWNEAESGAKAMIKGAVRGRAPGSEPNVEWSYLDWGGDGEVISFVHANGFCAASLALVAHALSGRYRVLAFDVRGHGDSTPVPPDNEGAAYSWTRLSEDYAVALSHRLGEIGRDRVRYALGHSFGGVLTLGAAARLSGRIEEMILLDPVILPPPAPDEGPGDLKGNRMADMTRRRRAVFADRETAYSHLATRELFRAFRPEALALYVGEGFAETDAGEVRLKCDPAVEAAVFEGGRSIDPYALAREVPVKTTLLHAAEGNFSRDVYDGLAALMSDATVRTVAGGHLFPMENPELVLDAID